MCVVRRIITAASEGKTYLVTGSTDGIGRYTVKRLAREQARVIVHGRNLQRVEDTVKEVVKETGNRNIQSYIYDLSSMTQVRQFAQDLRRDYEHIDVFINNAGVFEQQKRSTEDGLEYTWAVNVMAPYLLMCSMLDKITSRVINVSSLSASSSIDFDNLQQEKGYGYDLFDVWIVFVCDSAHNAYSLSKLCEMLITFSLAREMKPISNVTVNCLDPGNVNTKMLYAGWGSFGVPVNKADDVFFVATDPSLDEITDQYFVGKRVRSPPSIARDQSVQQRLLDILQQQTGEVLDASKARVKS